MTDEEDWNLVSQAREGERDAFAALVRRYHVPLIRFCQRMTGSIEDAEELAQECFVRVHRHLARLEPNARFSTLLFGIARNLTLNHLRDMNRRGRGRHVGLDVQPLAIAQTQETAVRRKEVAEVIAQALAQVSPEHREVILLREVEGLDYEAIAGVLGCQLGTVKSRLARAREALRVRLVALGVELP